MSRRFPAALYHKNYCLQKMAKIYIILANGKLKIRGVISKLKTALEKALFWPWKAKN